MRARDKVAEATMDATPSRARRLVRRFLAGNTSGQRLIIVLGGLATALLAIAALIGAIVKALDDGPAARTSAVDASVVENRSKDADQFIRFLLSNEGKTVQLDTKVKGEPGAAHVTVQYDCAKPSGCNLMRIESPTDAFSRIDGGMWIQGCFSVVKDGNGYGAEHLDIELHDTGKTCAP